MIPKETPPICAAPWTHSHVTAEGKRALCCVAQPFSQEETNIEKPFEDYWNSQTLKGIRESIIKGVLPESYCQVCLDKSSAGIRPYQNYQVTQVEWNFLLENLEENQKLNKLPAHLDYRIDNTCNLACRTCSGLLSSKIQNALEKTHHINDLALKKQKSITQSIDKEFTSLLANSNINRLYFAHGEAFIQKEHWQLLEKLIGENRAKNISIEYNTNLNHKKLFVEENLRILSKFKEIRLSVSLDDVGDTGEFIRDGLSWNHFVKNFETLINHPIIKLSRLDITFTLPLLLNIKPFIKFLETYRPPYTVRFIVPGNYASLLSPKFLPKDIQISLYEKAIKYIEEFHNGPYFENIKSFLKNNQNSAQEPIFDKEELEKIYRNATLLDETFNRQSLLDFYSTYPETKEFFEDLEDSWRRNEPVNWQYLGSQAEALWWQRLSFHLAPSLPMKCILFPKEEKLQDLLVRQKKVLISYPTAFLKWFFKGQESPLLNNELIICRINLLIYLMRKSGLTFKTLATLNIVLSRVLPFLNSHALLTLRQG